MLKYDLSGGAGGGVGYAISEYRKYVADANFRVRPELANLNWFGDMAAGHLNDWLFKTNPEPMAAITIASCALTGMGIA